MLRWSAGGSRRGGMRWIALLGSCRGGAGKRIGRSPELGSRSAPAGFRKRLSCRRECSSGMGLRQSGFRRIRR